MTSMLAIQNTYRFGHTPQCSHHSHAESSHHTHGPNCSHHHPHSDSSNHTNGPNCSHDHPHTHTHHKPKAKNQKRNILTETLHNIVMWFKEFIGGFIADMKDLLDFS